MPSFGNDWSVGSYAYSANYLADWRGQSPTSVGNTTISNANYGTTSSDVSGIMYGGTEHYGNGGSIWINNSFLIPKQITGQWFVERSNSNSSYIISLRVRDGVSVYAFAYEVPDYMICNSVSIEVLLEQAEGRLKSQVLQRLKEDNMAEWERWVAQGGTIDTWVSWSIDATEITRLKKMGVGYEDDRLQREKEKEEANRKEGQRKATAKDKALQLLKEVIGEISFAEYEKENYIELLMKSGKKYRLHNNTHVRNIEVLEKDEQDYKVKHRLCAHLSDMELPIEDNLVAQFLMLRDSEEEFLRMANVS